jgi:hypothetical protein
VRLRHAWLMPTFAVIVGTGWLNFDALADHNPPGGIPTSAESELPGHRRSGNPRRAARSASIRR